MGTLGDAQEPLLNLTLDVISGLTAKKNYEAKFPIEIYSSSEILNPLNEVMLMDGLVKTNLGTK